VPESLNFAKYIERLFDVQCVEQEGGEH